ncbi:MAG TPA: hypothetical protein VMW10_12125 [Alphaproteobacteria bacterium]|nr:hypothetical protein [Alphaproteobacteria bacterium]
MQMEMVISAGELRKALADIEAAEKNGFMFCLAVVKLASVETNLDQCQLRYNDIIEKAHPTDGKLNWGRFQCVSRNFKFKKGKLVPQKKARRAALKKD